MIPFPRLSTASTGTRGDRKSMLVPMRERWTGTELAELVEWMSVETSLRWLPRTRPDGSLATYCDHATADFLDQWFGAGRVPFPAWVWWVPRAIEAMQDGETLRPILRSTVRELGAPSLYRWLLDDGADYGWQYFKTAADLQKHCDECGHPGVIATLRHVAVCLPSQTAPDLKGSAPLTWQAGSRNWSYRREDDWFRRFPDTVFCCFHPPISE